MLWEGCLFPMDLFYLSTNCLELPTLEDMWEMNLSFPFASDYYSGYA